MKRLTKLLIVALTFILLASSVAACSPPEEIPSLHVCQSVCPDCNKCLNKDCSESVCLKKCAGHIELPAISVHKCESKCQTCQKCTDINCTKSVCAEKCKCQEEGNI